MPQTGPNGANNKNFIVRLTMTVDSGLKKLKVSFQGVPGNVILDEHLLIHNY